MFRALRFTFKVILFSAVVMVIGNLVEWKGKTVSDRIKTHLSQARQSPVIHQVKDWGEDLADRAKEKVNSISLKNRVGTGSMGESESHIPSSEREKLRSLIRELNKSHGP